MTQQTTNRLLLATTFLGVMMILAFIGLAPGEQVQEPRPAPPTQVVSEPVAEAPKPAVPVPSKPQLPPEAAQTSRPPEPPLPYDDTIVEENVLRAVNRERYEAGLGALRPDERLEGAAQAKAVDEVTRGYFAHQDPDGKPAWPLVASYGYDYEDAGENLARSFDSLDEMVDAWMESPSHRKNILDPRFEDLGVGIAVGRAEGRERSVYVVTLFGNPK